MLSSVTISNASKSTAAIILSVGGGTHDHFSVWNQHPSDLAQLQEQGPYLVTLKPKAIWKKLNTYHRSVNNHTQIGR